MKQLRFGLARVLAMPLTLAFVATSAGAQSSASYQVQSGTQDSGIASMSSTSYALGSASVGAAVFAGSTGQSASTGYDLQQGFVEVVGMPILKLSATTLAFGADTVGTPSPAEGVTITNDGAASMVVSGISVSSGYSETNNCGSLLASGASCVVSVTFNPTTTGSDPGALSIASDVSGSPSTVSLSGTGETSTADVPMPAWALGLLGVGLAMTRVPRRAQFRGRSSAGPCG